MGNESGPDSGDGWASSSGGDASDCGATMSLFGLANVYCGTTADGTTLACGLGQQCCLSESAGKGGLVPNQCAPWTRDASGCDGGLNAIGVACAQIRDCAANGVHGGTLACCLQGASVPALVGSCSYPESTSGVAVICESTPGAGDLAGSCASGEVQLCMTALDCPGTQCVTGYWKNFEVGFCE